MILNVFESNDWLQYVYVSLNRNFLNATPAVKLIKMATQHKLISVKLKRMRAAAVLATKVSMLDLLLQITPNAVMRVKKHETQLRRHLTLLLKYLVGRRTVQVLKELNKR